MTMIRQARAAVLESPSGRTSAVPAMRSWRPCLIGLRIVVTRRTIHQMNRARPAKPPAAGTIERRYSGNPSAAHRSDRLDGRQPGAVRRVPDLDVEDLLADRRAPAAGPEEHEIGEADERERDVQGGAADRGVHGRDGAVGAHGRPSVAERGPDDRSDDPDEEAVDEVGDEAGRRIRVAQTGCTRDRRGDGGRRVGPHDRPTGSARWRRSRWRSPRQRFALGRDGRWRRGLGGCPRVARGGCARVWRDSRVRRRRLPEAASPPTGVVSCRPPGPTEAAGEGLGGSGGSPVGPCSVIATLLQRA